MTRADVHNARQRNIQPIKENKPSYDLLFTLQQAWGAVKENEEKYNVNSLAPIHQTHFLESPFRQRRRT